MYFLTCVFCQILGLGRVLAHLACKEESNIIGVLCTCYYLFKILRVKAESSNHFCVPIKSWCDPVNSMAFFCTLSTAALTIQRINKRPWRNYASWYDVIFYCWLDNARAVRDWITTYSFILSLSISHSLSLSLFLCAMDALASLKQPEDTLFLLFRFSFISSAWIKGPQRHSN